MSYGLSEEQFKLLQKMVLEPLKRHGCEVYIFGSRTTDKHHSHSDVDILYRTTAPLPPGFLAKMKEEIEESRFPFAVDLVDETDLAESYRESIFSQMWRL